MSFNVFLLKNYLNFESPIFRMNLTANKNNEIFMICLIKLLHHLIQSFEDFSRF